MLLLYLITLNSKIPISVLSFKILLRSKVQKRIHNGRRYTADKRQIQGKTGINNWKHITNAEASIHGSLSGLISMKNSLNPVMAFTFTRHQPGWTPMGGFGAMREYLMEEWCSSLQWSSWSQYPSQRSCSHNFIRRFYVDCSFNLTAISPLFCFCMSSVWKCSIASHAGHLTHSLYRPGCLLSDHGWNESLEICHLTVCRQHLVLWLWDWCDQSAGTDALTTCLLHFHF